MKRIIRLLSLTLLFVPFFSLNYAHAKGGKEPTPAWVKRLPTPSNSTFSYQTTSGSGKTIAEANKRSWDQLFISAGMSSGVVVSIDHTLRQSSQQRYEDGHLSETIEEKSDHTTNIRSDEERLYVMDIDHYWERAPDGSYIVTRLVARSNSSRAPLFDEVETTSSYGVRGLWRSMIIPGWGQFYKGSNLKGGAMLGGVAVCAVAAIFTDNVAADYYSKIAHTYDVNHIRTYSTKGDNYISMRNICIGTAAALYLYNVVDAIAAPGARRVKSKRATTPQYSFTPSLLHNGAVGMVAGVLF